MIKQINGTTLVGMGDVELAKGTGATKAKRQRIDLGLALLGRVAEPRTAYDAAEIAAWCNCSRQRISQIELTALRKVLRELTLLEPELFAELRDMMAAMSQDRQIAKPVRKWNPSDEKHGAENE